MSFTPFYFTPTLRAPKPPAQTENDKQDVAHEKKPLNENDLTTFWWVPAESDKQTNVVVAFRAH